MNIPLTELDQILGIPSGDDENKKQAQATPAKAPAPLPAGKPPLSAGTPVPTPQGQPVELPGSKLLAPISQAPQHTAPAAPDLTLPKQDAPALPGGLAPQLPNLSAPTKKESQAAGKAEYERGMPMQPEAMGILPGQPGYGSEKQVIMDYEKQHPLGSDVSAKPGLWGKIEHGLGRAANIAGDILAPGITEAIPGSDLNNAEQAKGNAAWENMAAENQLKGAQTKEQQAAAWKNYNNPGLLGKTNDEQDLASLLRTNNPDTGKPYTVDEANAHIKQQTQDVKPVSEQNTPIGDAGVPQHTQQLQTLEVGMTPEQKTQFEKAYSVQPGDTRAIATKRLEDAKAAAGLSAGERDRALQRAIADRNAANVEADRRQRISDEEHTHQDVENDKHQAIIAKQRTPLEQTVNAYHEAGDLAQQKTGAGDYGLTMRFVEATKPNTGFRFTNTELQLIQSRRGLVDAASARLGGVVSGVMYDDKQRQQMLDVMKIRSDMDSARLAWMNAGNDLNKFGTGQIPKDVATWYFDAAGNKAAAMKMAKQDGWSF